MAGQIIEEVTQYKKRERIYGQDFVYSSSDTLHQVHEEWQIDGASVDKENFLSHKAQALAQELLEREQKEREQREQEIRMRKQARCDIIKKCLHAAVIEIEHYARVMKDYSLLDYALFSPSTFASSQEYNSLFEVTIPDARRVVVQVNAEIDEQHASELLRELEHAAEHMKLFFQQSRACAIERSDDTKLLKRLFELVS